MHLYRLPLLAALIALAASAFGWSIVGYSIGYVMLIVGWLLFDAYWQSELKRQVSIATIALFVLVPLVGVTHFIVTSSGWRHFVALIVLLLAIFSATLGAWMATYSGDETTRRTGLWFAVITGLFVPFFAYGSVAMDLFNTCVLVVVAVIIAIIVTHRKRKADKPKKTEELKEGQHV